MEDRRHVDDDVADILHPPRGEARGVGANDGAAGRAYARDDGHDNGHVDERGADRGGERRGTEAPYGRRLARRRVDADGYVADILDVPPRGENATRDDGYEGGYAEEDDEEDDEEGTFDASTEDEGNDEGYSEEGEEDEELGVGNGKGGANWPPSVWEASPATRRGARTVDLYVSNTPSGGDATRHVYGDLDDADEAVHLGSATWTERTTYLSDLYAFDAGAASWVRLHAGGVAVAPRAGHAAASARGGRLVVFGGFRRRQCGTTPIPCGEFSSELLQLDLLPAATWTRPITHGVPPAPRRDHSLTACDAALGASLDDGGGGSGGDKSLGAFVVFGGSGWALNTTSGTDSVGVGTYLNDVHVLELSAGARYSPRSLARSRAEKSRRRDASRRAGGVATWTLLRLGGAPPAPRSGHVAALAPSGTSVNVHCHAVPRHDVGDIPLHLHLTASGDHLRRV